MHSSCQASSWKVRHSGVDTSPPATSRVVPLPGPGDRIEVRALFGRPVIGDVPPGVKSGAPPRTISRIESDIPGLTALAYSVEIAAGESLEVGLSLRPDLAGSFSGTLTIFSDNPNRSSAHVQVSDFGTVILADSRADFNDDQKVNLGDFMLFVKAYDTTDSLFDLNENSVVDFGDFVIFVRSFGRPLP